MATQKETKRTRPTGVPDIAAPTRTATVSSRKPNKRPKSNESLDQGEREAILNSHPGAVVKSRAVQLPTGSTSPLVVMAAVAKILRHSGKAAEFWESDALAASTSYTGMPTGYRQFREDALVRKCVVTRATWATKAGFDVIIEPIEPILDEKGRRDKKAEETFLKPWQPLKDYLDQCNRVVNMDFKLRNMHIRAKLQGKAVQQIVWADKAENGLMQGDPKMLVPLRVDQIVPKTAPDWTFKGIAYKGRGSVQNPAYTADELLYFINEDLDEDKVGLSDVEPILWAVEARQNILQEDIPEAVTALWCATILWLLNRDKLPAGIIDDQVKTLLEAHVAAVAKPAHHYATTTLFEPPHRR